ncbi:MAG: 4-(cytidine 5'-diphospho)-2-C-methyl-D-erythritol kinase, partial [Fimbriimonadaceae bacterium]|nr:4-(cytidine 5'-diphospho)-2-C-methyl-D-erythritol kinase [Alphaproteobacteria bacterium]
MSGTPILARAPAKINLYLHVTGQRADGYHTLDTLAVFADTSDSVYVRRAQGGTDSVALDIGGPFAAQIPADAKNLVSKAANLMIDLARQTQTGAPPPVTITLIKRIPAASGIGGGSADAAAAIRALNRFWGLRAPIGELAKIAAKLGADVPMCLYSQALTARGTGDIIATTPGLPAIPALLVNPGIALETRQVFDALTARKNPRAANLASAPLDFAGLIKYLEKTRNDLEVPAIELVPEISDILNDLRKSAKCRLARMSGSGATCFG